MPSGIVFRLQTNSVRQSKQQADLRFRRMEAGPQANGLSRAESRRRVTDRRSWRRQVHCDTAFCGFAASQCLQGPLHSLRYRQRTRPSAAGCIDFRSAARASPWRPAAPDLSHHTAQSEQEAASGFALRRGPSDAACGAGTTALLLNLDMDSSCYFSPLLIGQPLLDRTLTLQIHEALRQPVSVRCRTRIPIRSACPCSPRCRTGSNNFLSARTRRARNSAFQPVILPAAFIDQLETPRVGHDHVMPQALQ
jgi:hypothetical protein